MANQDDYQLQRYAGETERLNVQNKLLVTLLGYHLHPTIPQRLLPSPRIADIGAGTGAFLVDLASHLPPTAQLDGYDISNTSWLPASQRPPNVTLTILDAKQAAPTALHNTYDIVCLRYLNAALSPSDPTTNTNSWLNIALHAHQLLKPGGALQWMEGDFSQLLTVYQGGTTFPSTKTTALEKFGTHAMRGLPHASWMTTNLRPLLVAQGFQDVRHSVTASDRVPEMRGPMTRMFFGACYAMLRQRVAGGKGETGVGDGDGEWPLDAVEALYREMLQEVEDGAYVTCDLHQFIGFKEL